MAEASVSTADNDILRQAREEYQADIDAERENRDDALDDLRFRAGDQWPQHVKNEREADGDRPCLTINRIPQFIRQVTGDIRINKPAIKVRPADDQSDKELAKLQEGLVRQIESFSDATDAYICAADSATACGMGHWRVDTEFADQLSFDQDIIINSIPNPFSVVWDKNAQKPNRSDAMHVFVVEELGTDEFKERYPDANTADFESDQLAEHVEDWGNKDTTRVAEYWTKKPVKRELARVVDGQSFRIVDLTDMPEPERAALVIERTREIESFDIEMRIISGVEVLEGPTPWPGRFFPIVSVWGEEINVGEKVVRHGMVRFAKDPQRIYNYDRSAAVESISLAPKSPFVGTVKMFEGNENTWAEANTKNYAYLVANPDPQMPGAIPQRQPPAAVPVALVQDAQIAAEDMKAVTGIHDASLGAKSNETSGIAIQARQVEGDVGTFVYIDNLARAIKHTGRIVIDLIPKVYDGERIVRILGEDDVEEFIAINRTVMEDGKPVLKNDLSAGKYDVRVVTGPSFSTKRAEASESMMKFAAAVPQAAELAADLIAKAQDWPGNEEIAERFRKVAVAKGIAEPEEGEEPPQPDQGTQMALLEGQIKKLEAETNLAKAQADIAASQADAAKKEAETEGLNLDNISKAMALALADSGLETMIAKAAAAAVAEMLPPANGSL